MRTANRDLFVAVQIETREAYESLDRIVRVQGIDSVVIGPWDLSGAIGTLGDVESPLVMAAIQRIVSAAKAAGIFVGAGMGVEPSYAATLRRLGVDWLQLGGDFSYLVWAADRILAEARQAMEG